MILDDGITKTGDQLGSRHVRFYYEELFTILFHFPSGEFTQKELIEKNGGSIKKFKRLISLSLITATNTPVKGSPTTKTWSIPKSIREKLSDYNEKYLNGCH